MHRHTPSITVSRPRRTAASLLAAALVAGGVVAAPAQAAPSHVVVSPVDGTSLAASPRPPYSDAWAVTFTPALALRPLQVGDTLVPPTEPSHIDVTPNPATRLLPPQVKAVTVDPSFVAPEGITVTVGDNGDVTVDATTAAPLMTKKAPLVIPVTITFADTTTTRLSDAYVAPTFIVADFDPDGDIDGDGIANGVDPDIDGDGVSNADERAAGLNYLAPDTTDPTGAKSGRGSAVADGVADSDGDGVSNAAESFVPRFWDEVQQIMLDMPLSDSNADGFGEQTVTDINGDGISDGYQHDYAGNGGDMDSDGLADVVDPDADGDGVNNDDEIAAGLDPLLSDTNGNGTPDGEEDADGDGLSNAAESFVPPGMFADVDGNNLPDPGITDRDLTNVADLVESASKIGGGESDPDSDGVPNSSDPDADGDGINNADEIFAAGLKDDAGFTVYAFDPLKLDSNRFDPYANDGLGDANADGIINKQQSFIPGSDHPVIDTDSDGVADSYAQGALQGKPFITDSNNNGTPDFIDPTWTKRAEFPRGLIEAEEPQPTSSPLTALTATSSESAKNTKLFSASSESSPQSQIIGVVGLLAAIAALLGAVAGFELWRFMKP